MSIDIVPRTCKNCTFYPCFRIDCGTKCDNHKFEHEKIIKETEKKVGK